MSLKNTPDSNGRLIFDTNEFVRLLTTEIGTKELAIKMEHTQSRYYYCLGLLRGAEVTDLFDNLSQAEAFSKKYKVIPQFYDPRTLAEILIGELDVGQALAHKFNVCEETYLRSIGAM